MTLNVDPFDLQAIFYIDLPIVVTSCDSQLYILTHAPAAAATAAFTRVRPNDFLRTQRTTTKKGRANSCASRQPAPIQNRR